ncbi:MAG: preprotein translocase subunit YajC [Clostridia bacterium]|nr:preprotein translocase subunit YajC [Clostridia bacterium]
MNITSALAETAGQAVSVTDSANAATATTGGAGDMISMVLMMAVMVAVFYFMLIRPQRKKDKAVKNMLDNLKVGDRIWTIGGFYGTVAGLKDDTVTLTMGSLQNTVVIKRSAVGGVENVAVENEAAPEI